ncbi:MAG TPA: APH(3') family aminoglycoside O-phosphotransferase [Caulobacteraceae bacterium]|nr:APH(3') family aminoglycoside O-phosphotransferase [Caulobacteraceae bacterium]
MDAWLDLAERACALGGLAREGLAVQPVDHGKSGAQVLRLDGAAPAILKAVPATDDGAVASLAREAQAMTWLAGRARTPRTYWSGELEGWRVLLTERLPGRPASHLPAAEAEGALARVAGALAALHAKPLADCPFDQRLSTKLAAAHTRLDAGLITPEDFDGRNRGQDPKAMFRRLEARIPLSEDLVLTHGDASLPNFIVPSEGQVGLVDLALFGVADRWHDLALFLRSSARNFPQVDAVAILKASYPLARIDQRRRKFYRLLDEFA